MNGLSRADLDALDPETVVVLTEGEDAGSAWVRRWDRRWASVRVTALGVGAGQGVPSAVLSRWASVVIHVPGEVPALAGRAGALYAERWSAARSTTPLEVPL